MGASVRKPRGDQMPEEGLEPSPCCQDGILNPARLPIPPLRLGKPASEKLAPFWTPTFSGMDGSNCTDPAGQHKHAPPERCGRRRRQAGATPVRVETHCYGLKHTSRADRRSVSGVHAQRRSLVR